MLKKKTEGERSPQRFLTQICNTEHDDTQKIFFVHFHRSWNPAGDRRLHRNRNNTNKLNNDGQSSRGEACHNPIICIRYYKYAPCVCVLMTSDTSLGAPTKFKMKTQLEQKKNQTCIIPVRLHCLKYFHVLSGELAFIQSHNHRDTDWRAD